MKQYAGIIGLIVIQLITIFLFRNLELDTVLALWTVVYIYMFSRRLFGLGMMATGHMGDIYMDDNVDRKVRDIDNKKASTYFKNIHTKWIYLALTIINGVATYILIKG